LEYFSIIVYQKHRHTRIRINMLKNKRQLLFSKNIPVDFAILKGMNYFCN